MGAGVENQGGSLSDVVSSIGPVLKTFIEEAVRKEVPTMKYVYDPDLSYQSGLERLRANNQMNQIEGEEAEPLPLFIFRRSGIRYPDDGTAPNARSSTGRGRLVDAESGDTAEYSFAHAEFDLDFLIVNKQMEQMEKMEISFLTEEGMTGTREIIVNMGEVLGDFKYYLTWTKFIDVDVQHEGNFYKALASSVRIRGFFFQFNTTSKRILEVNATIRQWYQDIGANEILKEMQIKP